LITIISEQDRDCIYHKNRKAIEIITNGIDQILLTDQKIIEKKYDLLFHGNLSYSPNINCVKYIIEEILPLLLKQNPNIQIAISGSDPTKKVKELCDKFPKNVILLGFVNDIISTYKSTHVFFAPLQIGTGLQNKLLEAMALKIPCITSELCNNALKAQPGKDILTGKNSQDYIEQINLLLHNQSLKEQLSENGHLFVKNNFSWEESTRKLLQIMKTNNHSNLNS
jgi:polysaccharide biosynthesis protein PslH